MFKMIDLPYALNALEPYYNQESLKIHYEILYKRYVDNANATLEKIKTARETNDYSNIKCLEKELSFQGSGAILHQLFFENMTPNREERTPKVELADRINLDFESFTNFKEQFIEAAKAVEASGWCLLVWVPNIQKLVILQCEKHQDLTLWGCKPLLVVDMWEHSYFLQYKADRAKYLNEFWQIINWEVVNNRFKLIQSKRD